MRDAAILAAALAGCGRRRDGRGSGGTAQGAGGRRVPGPKARPGQGPSRKRRHALRLTGQEPVCLVSVALQPKLSTRISEQMALSLDSNPAGSSVPGVSEAATACPGRFRDARAPSSPRRRVARCHFHPARQGESRALTRRYPRWAVGRIRISLTSTPGGAVERVQDLARRCPRLAAPTRRALLSKNSVSAMPGSISVTLILSFSWIWRSSGAATPRSPSPRTWSLSRASRAARAVPRPSW